ncbi:uncharacterized protein [Branchiostoma lanceolatum]|uniref:uncharacterized protein n=1 Tax=Branchiostoma lanceolatum TaxID=7740 RepID=UPI00345326FD
MADPFVDDDLYAFLGLTPTASREEILDTYKKEIILYEEAAKKSHKTSAFKEADTRYKSVRKAFFVLSDATRRQLYDGNNILPKAPKINKKFLKHATGYNVQENAQSITVFLPPNLAKSWLELCQEHHDTQAIDGGKNGKHVKTTFVDVKTGQSFGTVTIKVFESTNKLLIQGSAYQLWFSEVFPILKEKIGRTSNNDCVGDSHASVAVETVKAVTSSSPDVSSLCSTCGQPMASEACTTCPTVPKVLFDENSNETRDDVSGVGFEENSHETHEDVREVVFEEDSHETREDVLVDSAIKNDLCGSSDLSVFQDSINKLETCLANSISDRKTFENSVLQRMNTLETTLKTQMCIDLPSIDKKKLQDEIAHLTKAKSELQNQIDSLQRKHEELASTVGRLQTTVPLKTTETQTPNESSVRTERLLREVATISVQNRFQLLEENNGASRGDIRADVSNAGEKYTEQRAKAGTNDTSCMGNANNNLQDKTTETNRRYNANINLQDKTAETNRRYNVETSRRNKDLPPDVLILGDSNTKGIKVDVLYPNKSAKREVTFTITEATEFVEHSAVQEPKVLMFHVGTNDARDTRDAETVSERFRALVHTAHEKYPRAQIVLSSILPRDDPVLQRVGESVNASLKVISEGTRYVHVIDNSNLSVMGSIKRRLYSNDGYHLNRFGIRVLAANIKRVVNPLIGLGQYVSRASRPSQPSTQIPVSPMRSQEQRIHATSLSPAQWADQDRDRNAPMSFHPSTYDRDFPSLNQTAVHVTAPLERRNCPDSQRQEQPSSSPGTTGAPAAPRITPPPGPPQNRSAPMRQPATALGPPTPPVRPPFQQRQPSGPWGSPPPLFNLPPAPWGFLPPNAPVPGPAHSRMNSTPWPWHPAMMWPPMVASNMW